MPAFTSDPSMPSPNNKVPTESSPHRSWLSTRPPPTAVRDNCFLCAKAAYSPSHLTRRHEPLGQPVPVAQQVGSLFLSGSFSASQNGVLAYRGGKSATPISRLSWFDRQGKELGDAGEPGTYSYSDLALSPD